MTREERKTRILKLFGVKRIEDLTEGFEIAMAYDDAFE